MKAKVLPPTQEGLRLAADALTRGDVVAMPTETVYGLAGDALNETALTKIFEAKERPTFDPLIVHVSTKDISDLVNWNAMTTQARDLAGRLIQKFWPGPLTLVLPKSNKVPDLATSGLPSVAIRMPAHPTAQALLKEFGGPLAAPSANRFGKISPTTAQAVVDELGDRISFILDGGPCEIGVESTVIQITDSGEMNLLRPGGVSTEEIEKETGTRPRTVSTTHTGAPQLSPGSLDSHYAPTKPMSVLPFGSFSEKTLQELVSKTGELIGVLVYQGDAERLTSNRVIAHSLSRGGNASEAARNLFRMMRELDASPVARIFAEMPPTTEGLAHAIRDRLERASATPSASAPKEQKRR